MVSARAVALVLSLALLRDRERGLPSSLKRFNLTSGLSLLEQCAFGRSQDDCNDLQRNQTVISFTSVMNSEGVGRPTRPTDHRKLVFRADGCKPATAFTKEARIAPSEVFFKLEPTLEFILPSGVTSSRASKTSDLGQREESRAKLDSVPPFLHHRHRKVKQ